MLPLTDSFWTAKAWDLQRVFVEHSSPFQNGLQWVGPEACDAKCVTLKLRYSFLGKRPEEVRVPEDIEQLRRLSIGRRHDMHEIGWMHVMEKKVIPGSSVAVICMDMWNYHPCPCAWNRARRLLRPITKLMVTMRSKGATIVHAPGSTDEWNATKGYGSHVAFKRTEELKKRDSSPDWVGGEVPHKDRDVSSLNMGGFNVDNAGGGCR